MPDLSDLSEAKRGLLKKCLSGDAASSTESKSQIRPRPPGNIAPLSLTQEQVWLHGQITPAEVPVYNETLTIRRTDPLNLVALERTLRLPDGSALAIFAAGRTAGWIAHALEQRQDGRLIRPRASYAEAQAAPETSC